MSAVCKFEVFTHDTVPHYYVIEAHSVEVDDDSYMFHDEDGECVAFFERRDVYGFIRRDATQADAGNGV